MDILLLNIKNIDIQINFLKIVNLFLGLINLLNYRILTFMIKAQILKYIIFKKESIKFILTFILKIQN